MKLSFKNPSFMLVVGVFLGGGVVGMVWLIQPSEKFQAAEPTRPTTASRRSSSSRAGRDGDSRGRQRGETGARPVSTKDPREGWRDALQIQNFAERAAAISALMAEWGMIDPLAALEMAGTLPVGQLRTAAFTAAYGAWASEHLADAGQWATGHLTGPLAGEVFGVIAEAWA